MGKIKTFALCMAIIMLITIPILILGDTFNFETDDATDQSNIAPIKDPIVSAEIKDVNMAKECRMQ